MVIYRSWLMVQIVAKREARQPNHVASSLYILLCCQCPSKLPHLILLSCWTSAKIGPREGYTHNALIMGLNNSPWWVLKIQDFPIIHAWTYKAFSHPTQLSQMHAQRSWQICKRYMKTHYTAEKRYKLSASTVAVNSLSVCTEVSGPFFLP